MTDAITDHEFAQFQRFIYEAAGITLSHQKKALVAGRLAKRVRECQVDSYGAYFRLLAAGDAEGEVQRAVDLLTTNETYFFREPKHFDLLRALAIAPRPRATAFRVWSAASSTGEEAYSIAMVLADCLPGKAWEVVASDISARVLARARIGHYSVARTSHIPAAYLKRFCLRGVDKQHGTLLITREIRERVQFVSVNLNERLPAIGLFDVVFLRNVMIYFSPPTKRAVIARIVAVLKPEGHLFIGHSESLNELTDAVRLVTSANYQKVATQRGLPGR
jgi:chemotaxis protein methyltransferase CheR